MTSDPPFQHESGIRRAFRFIGAIMRWGGFIALGALFLAVVIPALHIFCGVCPLHFKHIQHKDLVPVIYGYMVLDDATLDRVARGKIVLGGCVVGPVCAVCPYCHCPARLRGASTNRNHKATRW